MWPVRETDPVLQAAVGQIFLDHVTAAATFHKLSEQTNKEVQEIHIEDSLPVWAAGGDHILTDPKLRQIHSLQQLTSSNQFTQFNLA